MYHAHTCRNHSLFLRLSSEMQIKIELVLTIYFCAVEIVSTAFLPITDLSSCAGHDDDHCKPSEIASSIDLVLKSGFKKRNYRRKYDRENRYLSYLKQVRAFPSRHRFKYNKEQLHNDLQHILTIQFRY